MKFIKMTTHIKKTHNLYSLRCNQNNHILRFGNFGIKSVSFGKLTENQLESIKYFISKCLKSIANSKKSIKVWNLVLLNLFLTKLSSESRMGKGKGIIYSKAVFLKPGTILFEFEGASKQQILEIFNFIKKKTSFKIVLINRSL